MSTDLEKFIQRNRDDFDKDHPSQHVWEQIRSKISAGNRKRSFYLKRPGRWSVAAAILITVLISFYFLFNNKYSHEKINSQDIASTGQTEPSGITPEYAVEFSKLTESVANRQKQLEQAANAQPDLYQQFQQDLAVLDSSYQLLKNQVSQSINRDVITKAMIQNLQLQAELLNRQLQIINQFKNTKKESHETNI
jgi:hypothetical protein